MSFSLADVIRTQAAARGDRTALHFQGRAITYRALDDRASRVAHGLVAAGVGPQEHVAYIDRNGPEYFEVLLGGAKANAVSVAVNWRLAPREMAFIVNDSQAKILFVGADFFGHLDEIETELTTVKKIIAIGDHPRHESYEAWMAAQRPDDPYIPVTGDDVCMQLYTSGTTGLPKGAMLTNDNFECLLAEVSNEWGFNPDAISIVCMPLFHIAGCGWGLIGLFNGCTSVLLREVNPAEILAAIPEYKVTHALFVPAVLQFLLMTPGCAETDFSSLRTIVYGASPISEEVLLSSIRMFGCEFIQVYGLTESTGAITQLGWADHDPGGPKAKLLRSCGRPYSWVEMRIVDPDTLTDRPAGEVGEVWLLSKQTMKGYWNQPEETHKAITADGWLRTGDAGYLEDGFLFMHDRVKDMIISGGENVYPAEIENALMGHPGIADVAAIGVPDPTWGETVKAVVVKAKGVEVGAEDVIAYARERLAHFKCPTSVDFVDMLPRNPSGKILKRELREPYWKGLERRVH